MLRANVEVVGQVDFGFASLLVDPQIVVLASNIDVSEAKFDDDCSDIDW